MAMWELKPHGCSGKFRWPGCSLGGALCNGQSDWPNATRLSNPICPPLPAKATMTLAHVPASLEQGSGGSGGQQLPRGNLTSSMSHSCWPNGSSQPSKWKRGSAHCLHLPRIPLQGHGRSCLQQAAASDANSPALHRLRWLCTRWCHEACTRRSTMQRLLLLAGIRAPSFPSWVEMTGQRCRLCPLPECALRIWTPPGPLGRSVAVSGRHLQVRDGRRPGVADSTAWRPTAHEPA